MEHHSDQLINEYLLQVPSLKWSDFVGYEELTSFLKQSIEFRNEQKFKRILIYGLPGIGKTYLSHTIGKTSNLNYYPFNCLFFFENNSCNIDKLNEMFKKAKNNKPSVLLLDEIAFIFRDNENEFISLMEEIKNEDQILFIGTSAKPWKIEYKYLEKFDKKIYIPLPNLKTRELLIRKYFTEKNTITDEQYEYLSQKTEGFSVSDLIMLNKQVCSIVIQKIMINHKPEEITENIPIIFDYYLEALQQIKPSLTQDDIKQYEKFNSQNLN